MLLLFYYAHIARACHRAMSFIKIFLLLLLLHITINNLLLSITYYYYYYYYCSTTLIPTAMNLSTRYFHEAPISITSQYDYSHIENTHSIAQLIKENPVVVINAVVETVTLRWPSFWNYTGLQAQGLKYFTFLPREILEFIQVLVNPAPRPVNNNNDYHCKPQQQQ